MEIYYLGHSSFKVRSKTAVLITDPFSPAMVGFKFPKTEADIVTISHQHSDHAEIQAIGGNPFVVSAPGEYEIKGVSIFGFPTFHDSKQGTERGQNTVYLIEADGLRIFHLGDLGVSLSPKILGEVNGVDVLMIPVGGVFTIGPKEAVDIISQIEPQIILPMHYRTPGINEKVFGKLAALEDFLKELGVGTFEKLDKLSLSKDKLPEETKVVVLERKS